MLAVAIILSVVAYLLLGATIAGLWRRWLVHPRKWHRDELVMATLAMGIVWPVVFAVGSIAAICFGILQLAELVSGQS